jgi:hypothetical protein
MIHKKINIKVRRRLLLTDAALHGGHARLQPGFRKRAGKSVVPAGHAEKALWGKMRNETSGDEAAAACCHHAK